MDAGRTFQQRVAEWLSKCFGNDIATDQSERNHRFLEESLELVQALGCSKSEALELVEYVYARPVGEPQQEAGGAILTLAALCTANQLDLAEAGDLELKRVWKNLERIRDKQASKRKGSALPH